MGFQVEELAESLVTLPALERDSRDWLFLRRNREETHTTVLLILRFFYHGDFHGKGILALESDSRDGLFLRRNREETHNTVLLILRFFYHGDFHGKGNFDFSLTSSRHNPNCRYARQT